MSARLLLFREGEEAKKVPLIAAEIVFGSLKTKVEGDVTVEGSTGDRHLERGTFYVQDWVRTAFHNNAALQLQWFGDGVLYLEAQVHISAVWLDFSGFNSSKVKFHFVGVRANET